MKAHLIDTHLLVPRSRSNIEVMFLKRWVFRGHKCFTNTSCCSRFSALSKPEDDSSRRYSGVSPARGEGRGRGFGRPPAIGARHSQESEKEKALAAAK